MTVVVPSAVMSPLETPVSRPLSKVHNLKVKGLGTLLNFQAILHQPMFDMLIEEELRSRCSGNTCDDNVWNAGFAFRSVRFERICITGFIFSLLA